MHADLMRTGREALREVCGGGTLSCRFTHVYPDGPAPYFTLMAPARKGSEIEQWDAIKRAVSEVLDAHGASITHHHSVGRDHRAWYDRQRPDGFARAVLLMVIIAAYNAIARYVSQEIGINGSSNSLIELQWYLFSMIFLLGARRNVI